MTDWTPPYEARDGKVWRKSTETRREDGTTAMTLSFPVCEVWSFLKSTDDQVPADAMIAFLMNAGDLAAVMYDALRDALPVIEHHMVLTPMREGPEHSADDRLVYDRFVNLMQKFEALREPMDARHSQASEDSGPGARPAGEGSEAPEEGQGDPPVR